MNKDMKEQILEELRQCEGAKEFVPGEENWYIRFYHCDGRLFPVYSHSSEILGVSICFPSKDLAIKTIETGEDYRTERHYFNVRIESVDSYYIRLRRLNYNSKQDPYPKVEISKIVEVNEVEE